MDQHPGIPGAKLSLMKLQLQILHYMWQDTSCPLPPIATVGVELRV